MKKFVFHSAAILLLATAMIGENYIQTSEGLPLEADSAYQGQAMVGPAPGAEISPLNPKPPGKFVEAVIRF